MLLRRMRKSIGADLEIVVNLPDDICRKLVVLDLGASRSLCLALRIGQRPVEDFHGSVGFRLLGRRVHQVRREHPDQESLIGREDIATMQKEFVDGHLVNQRKELGRKDPRNAVRAPGVP